MWIIIAVLIVAAFVGGGLVFRANRKNADKVVADVKTTASTVSQTVKKI